MFKNKDWNNKPCRAAGFPGSDRLKEAEAKLLKVKVC